MTENNGKNEDNGKNIEEVIIDINLDDDTDISKATEYFEKLFIIGEKFGELLYNEKLTIGEVLFVIYMLEKGVLSSENFIDSGDIYYSLLEDNKAKTDMIANMIIKNNIEKSEK